MLGICRDPIHHDISFGQRSSARWCDGRAKKRRAAGKNRPLAKALVLIYTCTPRPSHCMFCTWRSSTSGTCSRTATSSCAGGCCSLGRSTSGRIRHCLQSHGHICEFVICRGIRTDQATGTLIEVDSVWARLQVHGVIGLIWRRDRNSLCPS